jgi:hypothetical protein
MSVAPFDPRAMMVVEFPSQHVAEEAFFEQRKARPVPPRYPASVLDADPKWAKKFDKLRSLYLSQNPRAKPLADGAALDAKARKRIQLRSDLLKAVHDEIKKSNDAGKGLAADIDAFDKFRTNFETVNSGLPHEQQMYVGDEFLDPAARRVAEIAAAGVTPPADLFDALPDDPVSQQDIDATVSHLQDFKAKNDQSTKLHDAAVSELMKDKTDRKLNDPAVKELVEQADPILEKLRKSRDPFFVTVRDAYGPAYAAITDKPAVDPNLATFTGRTPLLKAVECLRQKAEDEGPDAGNLKKFLTALSATVLELVASVQDRMGLTGDENPTPMSRARLSGPSRLAFRINTDDFETGDQGGRIEFCASELTNWSRHELVVIRRAQKMLKSYADGSRRPVWDMQEDHDLATQLVHQGFSRGGWADRRKSKNGNDGPRNWSQAAVTAEQRLAEVAATAAAPPGPIETAIELPYRLLLSPAQDGRFRTRRQVPDWLVPKAKTDVAPLWTAAFLVEPNSALRAIWSPDFRPEAFVPGVVGAGKGCLLLPCPSRTNRSPMRGPYAPWAMGREMSDNPISADIDQAPRFRTSLDAFDRHELVSLSSLHGLPVIGKVGRDAQGNIVRLGKDQVEPPEGFQVSTPNWEQVDDDNRKLLPTLNDVYLPKALDPKGLELALSSLGGFLRVNASFDPPASILTGDGNDYYNALSIERWRHNIVLGRDISAEVVYKGYLFPIGLHCTLIKITERRFQRVDGRNGPVAVLRQRMFLRVGNPTKNFPAFKQPDGGRRLPFRTLTVVTTQTPDIVDPYDLSGGADEKDIYPNGRIDFKNGVARGTAFWPRTTKRLGGEVKFDLLVDGNIPTRLPLIFVDNAAANNKDAVELVCQHYNKLGLSSDAAKFTPALTQAGFGGAKLIYAPESKAGDTQFETQSVVFGAEGWATDRATKEFQLAPTTYRPFLNKDPDANERGTPTNANFVSDPFMQGADQPPFYPAMRFATVKIGQIERLVGHPLPPTRVAYDPSYALFGFPENNDQANGENPGDNSPAKQGDDPKAHNPKEIFLSTIDPPQLTFGQGGDKGGAVSRPEMTVHALSRKAGPISANPGPPTTPATTSGAGQQSNDPNPDVPDAITDRLNNIKDDKKQLAEAFFGKDATLLGLIKLSDLLEAIITLAGGRLPVLQELIEYGGGLVGDVDAQIKERVLEPLQQALGALDKLMMTSIPLGATGEVVEVKKIYPDVVSAYIALKKSVQTAIDAPPPSVSTGAGDTISTYTGVYTDGRRFVNAIERALRDPITPLREAAKQWLNDRIADVKETFDDEVNQFQRIVNSLTNSLRVNLRNYIVANILGPLKSAIFVVPPPNIAADQTPAAWAALSTLLDTSIDQALNDPGVWPSQGDTFFDVGEFRNRLAVHIREKAPAAIQDLADAQATALNQIHANEVAQALLLPDARNLLTDPSVGKYTQGLTGLQITDAEKLKGLFSLAAPVSKAVKQFESLKDIGSKFQSRCDAAATALTKLIAASMPGTAAAIPDPQTFNRLPGDLKVLVDKGDQILQQTPPDLQPTLQRLRGQFQLAIDTTKKPCSDISDDLTNLRSLIDQFGKEAGNFQQVTCVLPLPWQLQRLLNYVRQLPTQAARCIADARSIVTGLVDILKLVNTTSVLVQPLPSYTFVPQASSDPSTWTIPVGGNPDDVRKAASSVIDLLRQRFFSLIVPVLKASADAIQTLSLAGIPPPPVLGILPDARVTAFRDMAAAIDTIVANTDFAGIAADVQKVYSTTLYDQSIAKNVGTQVKALKDAGDLVVSLLSDNNAVVDQRLKTAIVALVGANENVAARAAEVVATVVGDATQSTFGTAPFDLATHPPIQVLLAMLFDRIAGQFQSKVQQIIGTITAFLTGGASGVSGQLQIFYKNSFDARKDFYDRITAMATSVGPVATQVGNALLAPKDAGLNINNDALAGQNNEITAIDGKLKAADGDKLKAIIDFFDFINSWSDDKYENPQAPVKGPNAVLLIVNQARDLVTNLVRDVLKGDLGKIIDFAAIKAEVERRLRELIPTKVTLTYDFDTELQNVFDIFLPEDGSRLTLKARTVVDVLNGGPPQVTSSGEMGPFRVKILGGFLDIVTLSFDGAKFGSETGGKLKANIIDVQLGEAVSFLQAVSSFFSFGANGFYLSFLWDPPGIEAGYRMPPCGFALGVLGISNISLNASAILPFDSSPALFKVGLSRPEAPFLINVAVYGGGGHLALYSTSQGIIGFESSFEFGAVVSFAIGPLTGNARITVGVFLRSFRDTTTDRNLSTIEGYTTVAGSASISIFRFSAMLQVRVGQQPNGEMVGTAIFTFSFSMGIKDIEFRVTARKNMGKGYSSNPQISDAGDTIDPLRKLVRLAGNLPHGPVSSDVSGGPHSLHATASKVQCGDEDEKNPGDNAVAYLKYDAVCKGENYAKYQSYFDHHQPWQPAFF